MGKRLQLARKACGKTQQDVAAYFGISPQAVSGWERDKEVPELEKFRQLPELLNVTADYLLNGEGQPEEADKLRGLFESLSGAQRRQALRILQALAETGEQSEVA